MLELKGNPNYAAFIYEVTQTHPLDGLDNLVGVNVGGYQACVPKTTKPGDRFVAVVAGTQISASYTMLLNLHRDSSLNADKNQTGYLENNRRVKAIRLRGNASNALLLDISLFPVDLSGERVGAEFDHINGVEFSRKFVVPAKASNLNGSTVAKKHKSGVTPEQFPEHYDTPQWHRVSQDFADKDVTVTQKLHGCFTAKTRVTMWDGSQKPISKVVVGDTVVGQSGGANVPSRVLKVATTGRTDMWLRTKFEQPIKGDKPTTVSTHDHKFFTQNRGYVAAQDLTAQDIVLYSKTQPGLTADKCAVLDGLMLGDGSIAGQRRNSVEWSHKEDHLEYVEYVRTLLGNVTGTGAVQRRTSGYGTEMCGARTKALETVRRHTAAWVRGVPDSLVLTDLTLAIWYMDDGSLSHHESQQDRANFAICAFNDTDIEVLRRSLVDYGFTNPRFYKADNYWRLRLNKDDAEVLFSRIRHLVPEVMQYKLPVYHRGYFEMPSVEDVEEHVTFETRMISQEEVTSLQVKRATKWDIETETSNFYASRILVHNSSIRSSWVEIDRPAKWYERLLIKAGVPVNLKKWKFVVGSRRVIKTEGDGDHWYSTDIWSEYAQTHNLAEALPKGVMVYGELIGWLPDGTPIQRGYTYNLPNEQAALYIYRVTVAGADGTHYDLSDAAMREFAAQRGLKVVPLLASFSHVEAEEGCLAHFLELYEDTKFCSYPRAFREAPVPLSPDSPCDEGVVIRAEGITPHVAKYKNQMFYEFESRAMDRGEVDIEDAAS